MDTDDIGEGLLRQATLLPVAAECAANRPLEITSMVMIDGGGRLLVRLQTYE